MSKARTWMGIVPTVLTAGAMSLAEACGGDPDAAPAVSDAAVDGAADATIPPDGGAPKDAGGRAFTAGTCGPTTRALRFGSPRSAGLSSPEENAAAVASDGPSVFLTGWHHGDVDFGGGTPDAGGGTIFFLTKLDADRKAAWTKTVTGGAGGGLFQSPFARAMAMTVDDGDGIVVAGAFAGTFALGGAPLLSAFDAGDAGDAGFGPCTLGVGDCFADAFVARFSRSDGAHRFSVRVGGPAGDVARAVAIGPSNEVVIAGTFEETADLGAGTVTSAGKTDAFVTRLDGDGKVLGSFRIGGTENDAAQAVAVDRTSGDIVVGGTYAGSLPLGPKTLTAKGKVDGFVVKTAPDGTVKWSRSTGASFGGQVMSVAIDDAGAVYVAGSFTGDADLGAGPVKSNYLDDAFVTKLDPGGTHVWTRVFSGNGEEIATALSLVKGGGLVVAGTSSATATIDYGGGPIGGGLYPGPFFVELDAAGAHRCSRAYPAADGPPAPDGSFAVRGGSTTGVSVSAGGFVATGGFGGTLDLGTGALTSAGGNDLWLADFPR